MHFARVVPDWRGDAADMGFVLFEIACVPFAANALKLGAELLDAAHRILREPAKFDSFQNLVQFIVVHVSEEDFADGGAVERDRRANPRMDAERFRGVEFFDIDGCELVTNGEVDGFARDAVQFSQVGQTEAANVELIPCSLTEGDTGNAEMIGARFVAVKEARSFEVDEETVDRADGETRGPGNFGSGEPARLPGEKMKHTQAALERRNAVSPLGFHSSTTRPGKGPRAKMKQQFNR